MKRKRLIFNDRAEWLEARKAGIGASEVGTVLGLNPYETPYQLWRRKIGLDVPKQENFAMKAGHYLEDAVSRFWADETGNEIIKSSFEDFMFVDEKRPFMRVSPDRLFWLPGMAKNDDNKGILECKTTQKNIEENDIPRTWFCQVQANLGVAHYEQGSLAWLTQGREFGYVNLAFVPDFYAWIVEEIEKFWTDNIIGGQEPAATAVSDILLKYNTHTDGKVVEADELIYDSCEHLKVIKEKITALENKATELESRIKMFFQDAESISYEGRTIATWKSNKASSKFDAKAFGTDHPDLFSEYTKETPGARVLRLK